MARLIVADEWRGPGEKKLAAVLQKELPADWTVIAGKKLPNGDASDIDFVVIGINQIFVIEEKAWRGAIVVEPEWWEIRNTGRKARNPFAATGYKTRVLVSHIRDSIAPLNVRLGNFRLGKAAVVMSDQTVSLHAGQSHMDLDNLYVLENCVQGILDQDSAQLSVLSEFRDAVTRLLTGLPNSDQGLKEIDNYAVNAVEELPNKVMVYRGSHKYTGAEVIIKCFPEFLFGEHNPKTFFEREIQAIQTLGNLNRTWRLENAFYYEPRNWFCVATELPAGNRTLRRSVSENDPARIQGKLDDELFAQVARDAFEGLASMHEVGLVHRGLAPDRIWLGPAMRVIFGDFSLSHIDENQTIHTWLFDDPKGLAFRAPECAESLLFATPKSDVYSLARVLGGWASGSFNQSTDVLEAALNSHGSIGQVIAKGLAEDLKSRLGTKEIIEELSRIAESTIASVETPAVSDSAPAATEVNTEIGVGLRFGDGGRFEILERLGAGGEAVTWKAFDYNRGYNVVLKFLHSRELYEMAQLEHQKVQAFHHPHLARSLDIFPQPEPGYLVQEYREGCNLGDRERFVISSAEQLRSLSIDLFDTLCYLEEMNFVHADLSPSNIIVFEGKPSLIDFGLTAPDGQTTIGINRTFSAPEVLVTNRVTHSSDLYSAACSLLYAVLGRRPYVEDDELIAVRHPTALTGEEKDIWGSEGEAIISVLFRGIENDPSQRPATAQEFKKLLISARPVPQAISSAIELVNENIEPLRMMYRASELGNKENRGLDSDFARATYVETRMDRELIPRIINGDLKFVALTGNPGDGKTALIRVLQDQLVVAGATFVDDGATRWECTIDGRTITAILDASESNGDLSSDENLQWALARLGEPSYTVVIAANDGRLFDFFTRFAHLYEDLELLVQKSLHGRPAESDGHVIIDLKSRALVSLDGAGPGLQIIDSITADSLWSTCSDCALNNRCPIFANRNSLRRSSKHGVSRLLLTSHLKGIRRSTIRDLKSAISWIITGDIGCEDVASAREQGRNLLYENGRLLEDLIFRPQTEDLLLEEWNSMDPASVMSPGVERKFRELSIDLPNSDVVALGMDSFKRRMFLESDDPLVQDTLSPYSHYRFYVSALDSKHTDLKAKLLLGLARIVGASGYAGTGLVVADKFAESEYSVLKVIPDNEFELEVAVGVHNFVESIPERVTLVHAPTSTRLHVNLDLAELLLRAGEGEILNDDATESYRQELHGFAMSVSRKQSGEALIVDANSNSWNVRQVGIELTLEPNNVI
jgi:serine/threonine protein kinase